MAQVVQSDRREPGEVGDHVEGVGNVGGVQRAALLVGELEPAAGPGVPGVLPLLVLLAPVAADIRDGVGVEGHGAVARVGLRPRRRLRPGGILPAAR